MKYQLHKIDDDYQIFGDVNGLAIKNHEHDLNYYSISINFFKEKSLIKVRTDLSDRTIHSENDIVKRINKMIAE